MKIKKLIRISLLTILTTALFSCGAAGGEPYYPNNGEDTSGGNTVIGSIYSDSTRKIVYTVSYTLSSDEYKTISNNVSSYVYTLNGYIASSETTPTSYYYVFKIPVESLNTFLSYMEEENGEVIIRQNITTEDVTTSYNEISSRIEVLNASKAAYVSILNNEGLSYEEIITINKEIEKINAELLTLHKELSSIESITDYAIIKILIRQPTQYEAEGNLSFLHTYVNYLKELGEYLIQFILYTLPFVAITGITITIVFVIRKKRNK